MEGARPRRRVRPLRLVKRWPTEPVDEAAVPMRAARAPPNELPPELAVLLWELFMEELAAEEVDPSVDSPSGLGMSHRWRPMSALALTSRTGKELPAQPVVRA